jgi:hypothetical protein
MGKTPFLRLASLALVLGCAEQRPPVRMNGVEVHGLTAAQVAQAVTVTHRDGNVVYRAPRLSATREVDLRRGPVVGANLGQIELGQSGFLYGVRAGGSSTVKHFAAFQSDFIEGKNRFASVTLADGSRPSFRTVSSDRRQCDPDCYVTFETLVVDLPESVLRSAPDAGVPVTITLDNGNRIDVTIPAAYARGYLQAIDAAGR